MSERDAYVEKLRAQLDEWSADIDKLEAKARKVAADKRIEHESQIKELRRKREEVVEKLTEVQSATESAWTDVKEGAEKMWQVFRESLNKAKSRFEE